MNVYEVINNRIMELLEQGTIPWRKPWNAERNMPKNLVSKKEYRGINIFMLSCTAYSSPYWLTFKQVQDKGGHVKKGEKSVPVIFWKWIDRESEEQENTKGKVPLLRYYNVFNIEQTEGIPLPEPVGENNDHQPLMGPEQIIKDMPLRPEIRFGSNQAAYFPAKDEVLLPHLSTFNSPEEYYCTLFHELAHSTGHISRLGRKSILEPSYFGSHEYSKEELVAEMGAAFLCGFTGIEQRTLENSASYIAGWLKVLKADKTLLVYTASAGQKVADFILNRQGGEIDAAIENEAA